MEVLCWMYGWRVVEYVELNVESELGRVCSAGCRGGE